MNRNRNTGEDKGSSGDTHPLISLARQLLKLESAGKVTDERVG